MTSGPWLRKPASFWIVAALGAAIFTLYPFAVRALVRSPETAWTSGWSVARSAQDVLQVTEVDPAGPAAGKLQPGDQILETNGFPDLARGLGWVLFMDLLPGDSYTIRVARGGLEHTYSLAVKAAGRNLEKLWLVQVPLLLISLSFFATGVAVGLFAPGDRVARLYAYLALMTATSLIPLGVFIGEPLHGRDRIVLNVAQVFVPFVLPVIFQFFSEFPPGVPHARVWSRVKLVLYAFGAVRLPVSVLTSIVTSRDAVSAAAFIRDHASLFEIQDRINGWFTPVALLAIVAVIVRNHIAVVNSAQRRRLRWVFLGSVVSAIPFTCVFLADLLMSGEAKSRIDHFTWLRAQSIAELFLVFLPMTFAYAVVAHRAIGVEVVIRRGLQYLLARNVLRAAIFLPVVLLGIRVISNADRTVAQIFFDSRFSFALAVAGAFGLYAREDLGRWLDRKFFREVYDREQVLLDLAGEIKRNENPGELARHLGQRIESSLHPRSVRLLFLEPTGSTFRLARASDEEAELHLRADSSVVRLLEDGEGSREVPFRGADLPAAEQSWLENLGVRLAVPVRAGERRLGGLLLLGEKRSEEPYSREDRRLLEAVADQIAIVFENASLRTRAALDAKVKHEVLARVDARGINLVMECPACGRCYDRGRDTCVTDGTALTFGLPVDRTIDGKYRLDRLLGRGGMGAVYEAADLGLGRPVAVKLMKGSSFGNEDALRRFDREARASARLRHPNIITVYDYGSVGGEVAYLVMERLVGTTLRAEIQRTAAVAPAMAAKWFGQILEGLSSAHAAGVIHRDLKPENVFLASNERGETLIKVLDFGLAKLKFPEAAESLTESGAVMGTLAYMSPEQLSGKPVDERADLFAVGVMVFESLTGRNPFLRKDTAATVAAILHEAIGLEQSAPEVRLLDAVLQRSVAKDRDRRFATAAEMQAPLVPALLRCPLLRGAEAVDGNAETQTG